MSTNQVPGGVRMNRAGDVVHGDGSKLTEAELQALPNAYKASLGVKPKAKPKPKAKAQVKVKLKPKPSLKTKPLKKDDGIPF